MIFTYEFHFSDLLEYLSLCVKAQTYWMVASPAARVLTPYCPVFQCQQICITLSTLVNCAFKVHIAFIPWILTFSTWVFSKHDFIFFNIRFWTWFWEFHKPSLSLQTWHRLSLLLQNPSLLCLCWMFLLMFLNLFTFLLLLIFLCFYDWMIFFTGDTSGQALHTCTSHPQYLGLWCCQYLIYSFFFFDQFVLLPINCKTMVVVQILSLVSAVWIWVQSSGHLRSHLRLWMVAVLPKLVWVCHLLEALLQYHSQAQHCH